MDITTFFKVTYGLYIVSAAKGKKLNGHVSNTVFQITSDPPRFAIGSHKDNLTTEYILKSNAFAISILEEDVDLDFLGPWGFKSGKKEKKFKKVNYKTGATGSPILIDHSLAWLDCELEQTIDTGTHYIFIGKVVDAEIVDDKKNPLTYSHYRDHIKGLSPANSPTYVGDKLEKSYQEGEAASQIDSGLKKYQCAICGFIYDPVEGDPHSGIAPGTAFEDIPDDWYCPVCGVTKKDFFPID